MSNYYVYSWEPMPRVDLFSKRDYNPANDYIAYNGVYLDPTPAKTWTRIPDRFKSLRHLDRTDRQGHIYHVFADEIVQANRERLHPRGVLFADHLPEGTEKAELEAEAERLNTAFRLASITEYEEALKEAEHNGKSLRAGTYVRECYQVCNMVMPNSAEAVLAQRQPGKAVADHLADALEKVFERMMAAKAGGSGARNQSHAGAGIPSK